MAANKKFHDAVTKPLLNSSMVANDKISPIDLSCPIERPVLCYNGNTKAVWRKIIDRSGTISK